MKKIITFIVVQILILGALGVAGINTTKKQDFKKINNEIEIDIQQPIIVEESNDNIVVNFKDEQPYIVNPGQPMLPKIIKKVELPFGVKNINVELNSKGTTEIKISKEIKPASSPMPKSPIECFKP